MNHSPSGRREPPDHHAPVAPGPDCAHFATWLPLYDEHALDPSDEHATRAHLLGCAWCQGQRAAYATVDVALRRYVGALTAAAPLFSEEEIMRHASDFTSRPQRTTEPNVPAASLPTPAWSVDELPLPTRYVPPTPSPRHGGRRRFLSGLGALAAVALIVALTVAIFAPRILHRQGPATGAPPSPTPTLSQLTAYADAQGKLYALRASDGKVERVLPLSRPYVMFSAPALAQGVRYQLASAGSDPNQTILNATRLSDGKQLWSEPIDNIWTWSLTVVDGVIYLDTDVAGGGTTPLIGTTHAVYAYRSSDGKLLWRTLEPGYVIAPPLVGNGVIYTMITSQTSEFAQAIALRASDGSALWSAPVDTGGQPAFAAWGTLADNATYWRISLGSPTGDKADFQAAEVALRADNGAQQWRVSLGVDTNSSQWPYSPVVVNSVLYDKTSSVDPASSSRTQVQVFALRASDGKRLWRFVDAITGQGNIQEVAASNGVVYLPEYGGALVALQASSGTVLWRATIDDPGSAGADLGTSTPVVADGVLFLTSDLFVIAVRATDGHALWRQYTGDVLGEPPILASMRGDLTSETTTPDQPTGPGSLHCVRRPARRVGVGTCPGALRPTLHGRQAPYLQRNPKPASQPPWRYPASHRGRSPSHARRRTTGTPPAAGAHTSPNSTAAD